MRPDTSIVVPVWGHYGDTLIGALDSLAAQGLPARILVVDNASDVALPTLEGVDLVRSAARLTVGSARNLGLQQVETPYVLFWDADDLMLAGTLDFLHEQLDSDPRLVAVAASILQDEPRVRYRFPRRWTFPLARVPWAFALAHSVWSLFPTTGCTLMRTSAIREAGGYADANSGEDWVLGVSLAFRGRVEVHSRPGRIYRRHRGSLWEQRRSLRHLLRHASAVRRRIRQDPGVPLWAKLALPLVAALQLIALFVGRPLVRLARRASKPHQA